MPKILNGQIWVQDRGACHRFMLLMLSHNDAGELRWARVYPGDRRCPPLLKTDPSGLGKWQYTEAEIVSIIERFKYRLRGTARIEVTDA